LLAGDRALRIYNGLDLGRVRDRASRVRTGDGTVRIGHVGRLVEQKNQARMIEGLARARAVTGLDLRLEIVGGGPLLPDLQATARRAGVADFVEFAGAVTRGGVYERLARWDAFVMPSKFEGFCNALVEAMAAGLPIAVSDIDTLREVAGAGALRFDPADAASIGEAFALTCPHGPFARPFRRPLRHGPCRRAAHVALPAAPRRSAPCRAGSASRGSERVT
jgi:glycosyltransferase involved in cell wall biosynthesis